MKSLIMLADLRLPAATTRRTHFPTEVYHTSTKHTLHHRTGVEQADIDIAVRKAESHPKLTANNPHVANQVFQKFGPWAHDVFAQLVSNSFEHACRCHHTVWNDTVKSFDL
jgi:hypothetical protein